MQEDKIRSFMEHCRLCPRNCGANRMAGQRGRCGADARVMVARAALHMWEEPCISGAEGSGTVFFTGCSLGCVYCQNRKISRGEGGREVSIDQLADLFLQLQDQRANNINLVTAGHYAPQVAAALELARERGLSIPVVYNSSGYETPDTLRLFEGMVQVYLPDFKYMSPELAERYSNSRDYVKTAKSALEEMVRQAGSPQFDARGMMTGGVIVRHLLLPGHVSDSKRVVEYLYQTYGNRIYISLMNQYTPMPAMAKDPLLSRRVTRREYERLVDYAISLGVEQGFIQEGETAVESFIPEFNGEGVAERDDEEKQR